MGVFIYKHNPYKENTNHQEVIRMNDPYNTKNDITEVFND